MTMPSKKSGALLVEHTPAQEELNHFLSYCNDVNMDLDVEVNSQSVETSEASGPTLLWSTSFKQFLAIFVLAPQ
jgi:hypothetical protein